jgi:hypothetical protein
MIRRACFALIAMWIVASPASARAQGANDQTCPDATDTPDILAYYLEVAYRTFQKDSSAELPPPCLLAAITRSSARALPTTAADHGPTRWLEIQRSFPDSTFAHALALTDASLRRAANDTSLLETRVTLLGRVHRFGEVVAAFDLFIARDSAGGTLSDYKLAISSARRSADTVAMLRYLTAATAKFPTGSQLATELKVLREVPRLRSLTDSVRRAMRADPSLTLGYASLVSIYGSLDEPDSTLAFLRRGLAHGVPRKTMATSLQSLIGALLREAQISDAPDIWERTLPVAIDIDSAMSTPETKHLVALTIFHAAEGRLDVRNFYLPALEIHRGYPPIESIDVTRVPTVPTDPACPSITAMIELLTHADERMTSGGNQFAPQTASTIVAGLRGMRGQLMPFAANCTSK